MRRIILNLALSLDGFIEGPNGEYDWCFTDQDYGLPDFLEQIDALLMGRKTYEVLTAAGPDPFSSKMKYVVSKAMTSGGPDVSIISSDVATRIRSLREETGKDIWLFGGAQLTDLLLQERLIDEFQLSIHPILLGNGTRLFRGHESRLSLKLISSKNYSSGLVQACYRPK